MKLFAAVMPLFVVGISMVHFHHKIVVHPHHSGKGYADALITFFKEKGRKEGYPEVRIDVREKKTKLRAMYERNGFKLLKTGQFVSEFTTALYHYPF